MLYGDVAQLINAFDFNYGMDFQDDMVNGLFDKIYECHVIGKLLPYTTAHNSLTGECGYLLG